MHHNTGECSRHKRDLLGKHTHRFLRIHRGVLKNFNFFLIFERSNVSLDVLRKIVLLKNLTHRFECLKMEIISKIAFYVPLFHASNVFEVFLIILSQPKLLELHFNLLWNCECCTSNNCFEPQSLYMRIVSILLIVLLCNVQCICLPVY